MTNYPIYQVDAFTDRPFAGNPAGVCPLPVPAFPAAGWMQAVAKAVPTHAIALDGETVCRSHDRAASKAALHLASAWASADQLGLAQVAVED